MSRLWKPAREVNWKCSVLLFHVKSESNLTEVF